MTIERKVRIRKSGTIRPVGPYSQDIVLGHIDRRSKEGRLIDAFKADLIAQVGGKPTPPQGMTIAQLAQLHLRIELMNARWASTGESTPTEGKNYRAWVSLFDKLMARLLGPIRAAPPATPPPRDALKDHLEARRHGR